MQATNATTLRLGRTDVLRIGLGTNRLTNTPEHVAFLREAVELGVRMIDTAHLYTGGESEATIAAALSPVPTGASSRRRVGTTPAKAAPTCCVDRSRRACGA
jgi:pyridoxine 4-dehydrogenase